MGGSLDIGLCAYVDLEVLGFSGVGVLFLVGLDGFFLWVVGSFQVLGFRSLWVLLGSFLWAGFGYSCVYSLCT
jgi:hypothetical protein